MKKLIKEDDGTLTITDGTNILGALLPVKGKDGMFKVRMGVSGGFYLTPVTFNEGLLTLQKALINSYKRRIESSMRGANLIYKRG